MGMDVCTADTHTQGGHKTLRSQWAHAILVVHQVNQHLALPGKHSERTPRAHIAILQQAHEFIDLRRIHASALHIVRQNWHQRVRIVRSLLTKIVAAIARHGRVRRFECPCRSTNGTGTRIDAAAPCKDGL